ncbi:hypothetical protein OSB04_031914 [Centaurea solstitialis]|uniref:ATP-dependent DNA helicase n=1 Tax=Centaurea solstitialis TaxID=347529 RepID=A0AA38W8K2_9ASTR|nr:hypothetical protein OSB04_031914 [Centaurea solstitialis]
MRIINEEGDNGVVTQDDAQQKSRKATNINVAGIWVEGNDNITAYKRRIIVYGRSDYNQEIQAHFGCYDPLAYPLFFPNGESGWHSKIPRHGVSINEVVDVDEIMEEDSEADLYQGIVDCVNAGEVQPSRVGQRVVLPASFIGGSRDMRRRFLDAMALVQDDGKPDIFLTMMCNPKWLEILKELLPEDLKDQLFQKNIIGTVIAYVYVIEFQKRDLLHAHFLLIMRAEDKMANPDHHDKIVCAETPDPAKYPEMHQFDVQHMMHAPCGHLRPSSPCMQGEPKRCRFRYPRQFNDKTSNAENSYPLYQMRDLRRDVNVRDVRYVSPPKAMWRIFSFALSQIHLYVTALQLHLPNKQMVRFREDDIMVDIVARERVSNALKRLFATILTYCEPEDVCKLWDEHYESLLKDYRRQCKSVDHVQNLVLTGIATFLQSMGKNIDDYALPKIYADANLQIGSFREVQDEYSILVEDEHLRARDALNLDQKYAYDEIMKHVDDDRPGVFFIDGPGGTGKTFLYKALLANIRFHGLIALATASSGVAANNMPGGRTTHSRFKILLSL